MRSGALSFLCLCLTLLLCPVNLAGQGAGYKLHGRVTDIDNEPLAGAAVMIKGVNRGEITDTDGHYVLANVQAQDVLVVSFLGMKTLEVPVEGRKELNIVLEADGQMIEETVVIAYSEVSSKDLTGSVGRAKMDDIARSDAVNIGEALAGRIAGVQITSNEGMPGEEVNIIVRGTNSVTQSNTPLYVIDGFPLEDASLNTLNPSDIASISILKDASATALYGARAANGVVIVTTKLGTPGTMRVSLEASAGFAEITRKIPLMNAYEFVLLQKEIMTESDFASKYLAGGISVEDYRNVQSIDWQDKVFCTAPVQKYSVNLAGGNRSTRHSTTLSYYDQDGIIRNSNYSRFQGMSRLDHRFGKGWHVQASLNYSRITQKGDSPSQTGYTGSANLLPTVWSYRPFAVAGDDEDLLNELVDPSINPATDYRINPLYIVNEEVRKRVDNNFRGTAFLEYELPFGLRFKVLGGLVSDEYSDEQFNGSHSRTGNKYRSDGVNASVRQKSGLQWLNENTMSWKKSFGSMKAHTLDLLAGHTMQGNRTRTTYLRVTHIPNENMGMSGLSQGTPTLSTYTSPQWTLMSFLARANYNYKSRYYLTASVRGDGSSKFPQTNRWAVFPSASLAWNVAEEDFMRSLSFVSTLKLRTSWGKTGNNRVSEYAWRMQMNATEESEYPLDNMNTTGNVIVNLGNSSLKWETTEQYDAGLDLGLFDNRISFTADAYRKITSDLLLSADIPPSSGFLTDMINVGKVQNEGLEFTLSTVNLNKRNLKWRSDFNISFNRNKVLALSGDQKEIISVISYSNAYIARVGQPLGMMYGFEYEGTYKYEDFDLVDGKYVLKDDVAENGTGRSGIQPGDSKYKDQNGDLTINSEDCVVIGRGMPLHTGGFNNTVEFFGFDLNVYLQWSYGNDILNAARPNFMRGKSEAGYNRWKAYTGRWTPDNPDSDIPRVGGWVAGFSSFEVEDGSFLRLKNVSLGYSLPAKLLKPLSMSQCRIYASVQNLYTWTAYTGYDPEVSTKNTALTPGYDYSAYPRARTMTFGVNITF